MAQTIKKIALTFLIVDVVIIVFGLLFGGESFVLNSQIAVFCSLFIVIGTFFGYYRNIKSKVSSRIVNMEQPDIIDKIDDPHDLYSDFKVNEQQEFTTQEIKDIINEEKRGLKTNSFKNTISSLGSFASVYRMVGYLLLVVGFFYLRNNDMLNIYGFLAGVSIVPIGTLLFQLNTKH